MKNKLITFVKILLIILNLVAAMYALFLKRPIYRMQIFPAMSLYNKLQTNHLIVTNRLMEVFQPDRPTDSYSQDIPMQFIRSKVTPWIHQTILAWIFIINAIMVGLSFFGKHRAEQSVAPYDAPRRADGDP
jgi:hypothetical protein